MGQNLLGRLILTIAGTCMLAFGWPVQAASSTAERWVRIDSPADLLFLRHSVDFASFDKIMIDPLSVWYANSNPGENQALANNIERLCAAFNRAFYKGLEQAGYEIVTEPGEGVLRLHVEIIDMKLSSSKADARAYGSKYLFAVAPGQITLVASLHDSQSDEVLLRMADVEKGRDVYGTMQPLSVWDEVDTAFERWSTIVGASIGEAPAGRDLKMVLTSP